MNPIIPWNLGSWVNLLVTPTGIYVRADAVETAKPEPKPILAKANAS